MELSLVYQGTTPDYWANASDELIATALAVANELKD